jgi:hypothetical protein
MKPPNQSFGSVPVFLACTGAEFDWVRMVASRSSKKDQRDINQEGLGGLRFYHKKWVSSPLLGLLPPLFDLTII